MSKYIITCESTVDLSIDLIKEYEIPFISYTFLLDNREYYDDFGKSYPINKFYDDIKNGSQPSTSQINSMRYKNFFENYLKEGYDIIHICLSSGITSSFNSACLASKELNENYDNKVVIIDSLNASGGQGMLALIAKENLNKGLTFEDNIKYLEDIKYNLNAWFFSSDLSSYIRGGRISKTSGFIGTTLKICPVLEINNEGKLIVREKIRTIHKAINELVKKMKDNALDGIEYNDKVYINHSGCLDDALELKRQIEEEFKNIKDIKIFDVGTVIGTHTGPGTVGLFFIGNKRIN